MDGFEIIDKIGEGAYSVVYKVLRKEDKTIYALKKVKLLSLSSKEKQNSLNEVRILASIKSNFVVPYKEAFFEEKSSCLCIVMEYADNGDLFGKITQHKKKRYLFEETEIWRIAIQMIKGLKALHDKKILHRDLKSANVFLYKDGSAKLGDLNVSKVIKQGMNYTQTGTPYYASPEVWNEKAYDEKSDIWSLGCVIYEMICLKPPFRAQNMEGLYHKVQKGVYSNIPDVFSPDLGLLIKLLIQVEPNKRPTCAALLNTKIIQRRIEYFKNAYDGDDVNEDIALMKTITCPKNLCFLSNQLPLPSYVNKKKIVSKTEFNSQTTSTRENKTTVNTEGNKLIKNSNIKENHLLPKIIITNKQQQQQSSLLQEQSSQPQKMKIILRSSNNSNNVNTNTNSNSNEVHKSNNPSSHEEHTKHKERYLPVIKYHEPVYHRVSINLQARKHYNIVNKSQQPRQLINYNVYPYNRKKPLDLERNRKKLELYNRPGRDIYQYFKYISNK